MLSHIISLLLFGVATSFSPGPNNIMTAYTMFNFGFKKTIPTILGVITGWTVLIIILQLGSSAVFQKIDNLQNIIKIFGSFFLIYMAYKISFVKDKSEKANPKPITFVNTFFFQFINPKGIIIALVGISTFIDVQNNFFRDTIIFTIVFFLMAVSSQAAWCLTGKYMRKFATTDRFIQNFNYSMSFLLIVCVILFYV